jgi:hypothetical protein
MFDKRIMVILQFRIYGIVIESVITFPACKNYREYRVKEFAHEKFKSH